MNKKILPILIAAGMLVLSGCGEGGLGYDDLESLAISNKTEIQAAWQVGETERTLTFATEPEINVTNEINNGHLVVTSSDVAVASVVGRVIMALSAGTATISVSYAEHVWDTVDVTITARPTNKDKFGTVHEGSLTDPLDNEDAITVGKWAKTEGNGSAFTTTEKFYISGVVDSFYHAPGSRTDGLVSWYLKPAEGKTEKFEVYKCAKNEAGDALTWDDIWADGTAVAYGAITFYGNQMETPSAIFVSCEGNKPEPQQTIPSTVTNALAVGAALADGDSTYDLYAVTGYVVKKSGSDFYMAELATETVDANMIMLYAYTDTAGIMLKGAKVTATMSLKNYHGVIENSGTPTIVLITAGVAWEINYTDATVAEALVVANALEHNTVSPAYYKVTGVIVAITSPWSSQYGNMNFTIGDTAADTELLLIYRLVCTEAESADFVVGASIVIGGQLKKYNTDLEMIAPVVFDVTSGETPVESVLLAKYDLADVVRTPYVDGVNSKYLAGEFATFLKTKVAVGGTDALASSSGETNVYTAAQSGGTTGPQFNGIKFGSGSAGGSVTLAFNAGTNITKVVVGCAGWATPNTDTLSVGGVVKTPVQGSVTATVEEVVFDLSAASDSIAIATNKRIVINYISVYVAATV